MSTSSIIVQIMGHMQAGFKGALSYRVGRGVAGYTGYCPAAEGIPLCTKGSTRRTGAQFMQRLFMQAATLRLLHMLGAHL